MTADLPYAGTSGWSGTDTSEARARGADESGATGKRQAEVLEYLRQSGAEGLTVANLRSGTGWHHGKASGLLSGLHKAGRIERLALTRNRCHVYVLPRYVMGRLTQPHGRRESASLGDTVTISVERYNDLMVKAEAFDRMLAETVQHDTWGT